MAGTMGKAAGSVKQRLQARVDAPVGRAFPFVSDA
jgi:hypothetical protein